MGQRIGVLGGTFDPIHHGHLAAAEECRAALRLDLVLFVPAGQPPHKRGKRISPASDRVAMVELAIAANPSFRVSRVDVDRAGPSYTIGALEQLRRELGDDAELWFIMGADSLADVLTWRDPHRLIELARLAAVNRPGAPMPDPASLDGRLPGARRRIDVVAIPALAIASTDLRRRVRAGRPIRYQTPDAVEQYVREHALYQGRSPRPPTSSLVPSEGAHHG